MPVSDIGFAPFAALPIGERLLIDRFALVLLPDVEALLGLSAAGQRWESEIRMRSIVVGDPDLSGDPQWEFPPLAGARSEALEVAALFGQQPLLGQQATRTHVLDQLKRRSDAKLIYLATHAMSDAVNPMDGSFLGLAEDHLYGRDIKGLIFSNNPLVVMSACQTGLGKVFEGGTFGLVRAWYHVGSPQIVMSLWNIDDDATKDMMVEFMRRLKAGELTEFALQRAMLTTRARYRDPALWASVALFGLPSRRPETREAPRSGARPTNLTERAAATVGPAIGEAQRVVLHEENPDDRSLQRFAGSVIWRIEKMPSVDGQAPELAVRADVTIPERNITMTWTLRRNTDLTLPASHIVTTSFAIPAEFQRGGVQNVPGILMKSSEEARGVQATSAEKDPGSVRW